MKTTLNQAFFKRARTLAGAILLIASALLTSHCSPSVEEIRAENVPKLQAILAKHKPRITDYKSRLMQLKETLKGIDTPFVSAIRLQPVLRTGNTGAPENLLIYVMKELDEPDMLADFTDHYGMFCPETFKCAIYAYQEAYLINSFDEEPAYLEKTLSECNLDSFPYALIMEELGRDKLELGTDSFSGGTVNVKVYLVDMRSNTVLGCELITAGPPVIISAYVSESEDANSALKSQAVSMTNHTIEEKVILFLKKFKGFIYNYDEKQPELE